MNLIGTYRNAGYAALADGICAFYDRRTDLQRRGVAFGEPQAEGVAPATPAKVSTDISLVAIDRSDPEAFALAEVIVRGVNAGLERYLQERPLLRQCAPEQALFVLPIFNLQRYAPGEAFHAWHCDWTTSDEATEPIRRVLAWILYCNDVPDGGTEFHWQDHHVEAVKGTLAIFPAGISHIHRGRVSHEHTKTIATGWINTGRREDYIARLASS
ncbi:MULTISPECIES: 2OG-Fe(II) oxygenase [unclassified Synechococcus]|uniref:2OG-Fe(II) oxygenase n=1 Tax=unclassified Synechococcus TaxID=2626047 RepID=UPI0021A78473|nr:MULTISPECIES: 2OG-Fe(II) oxygenase [unclassified Synechococcus]MCT0212209.1 2OG-Fe(II) oxygenase [Synechococcus sp. CS-1326]MCT0234378.1 2OG-Fe(II) oxygenase [Synechococcus sp. CS-1327]